MRYFVQLFLRTSTQWYFLEAPNFIEANPLKTPEHYCAIMVLNTILLSIKGNSSAVWLTISWSIRNVCSTWSVFPPSLARSEAQLNQYAIEAQSINGFLGAFVVSFIMLGWLGVQPVTPLYVLLARIFTTLYFSFFILMPWFSTLGKTKEVPERVTG